MRYTNPRTHSRKFQFHSNFSSLILWHKKTAISEQKYEPILQTCCERTRFWFRRCILVIRACLAASSWPQLHFDSPRITQKLVRMTLIALSASCTATGVISSYRVVRILVWGPTIMTVKLQEIPILTLNSKTCFNDSWSKHLNYDIQYLHDVCYFF